MFGMASSLPMTCTLAGLCLSAAMTAQSATADPPRSGSTHKVTSPKEFLGNQVGADHFLANYTQLRGY